MSNQVLGWAPLVWTLRIASTVLIAGASTVVFLYLLRILRPRHIVEIVGGDLRPMKETASTAQEPEDIPDWLVRFDAIEERKRRVKEALFREMVRVAGMAGARRYRRLYGKRRKSGKT